MKTLMFVLYAVVLVLVTLPLPKKAGKWVAICMGAKRVRIWRVRYDAEEIRRKWAEEVKECGCSQSVFLAAQYGGGL